MGYFEDLTKAFDNPLIAFGSTNSIAVALENIDAPTSVNTPYLASFMLLAPTEQADLFFTEQRTGIYQIDIKYASAKGSAPINKMADLLNAAFKAGNTFPRNGICAEVTSVDISEVRVENGWATRSLSINFIAFTARL